MGLGKLWFEVGIWCIPSSRCEMQLAMGVVRALKFPISVGGGGYHSNRLRAAPYVLFYLWGKT